MDTGLTCIGLHPLAAASSAKTPLRTLGRKPRAAAPGLNLAADSFPKELELRRGGAHPV